MEVMACQDCRRTEMANLTKVGDAKPRIYRMAWKVCHPKIARLAKKANLTKVSDAKPWV
jgi:hypothetical protein